MNPEKHEIIEELADDFGKFRKDYSGRGMYGETCVGIVTGDPTGCIEEAEARGVRGAVTDSMGLSIIVYWPKVKYPD